MSPPTLLPPTPLRRPLALAMAALLSLAALGPALVPTLTSAADPGAGCLETAAEWAGVHPTLLRAIAWVESRGNPGALHWNTNGTYDVGLMQINSWWYERGLKGLWLRLGDPCINVAAGAWVLRQCVETYGYTWNAVGCYHAGAGWTASPMRRAAGHRYITWVRATLTPSAFVENDTNMLLSKSPLRTTMRPSRRQTP